MKRYLPVLLLISLPAIAGNGTSVSPLGFVVTGQPTLSWDGVGNNGVINQNGWWSNGAITVIFYTGDDPESYGSFSLKMPLTLFPLAADATGQQRPICVSGDMQTNPDYSSGYTSQQVPLIHIRQWAYNREPSAFSQSFDWYSSGGPLLARSTYTVNIVCPPKAGALQNVQ